MAEVGHETRIALLEQSQRDTRSYFEQSQRESKEQLKKMADDMAKIAHAVAQQADDRSALVRAFNQLESHTRMIEDLNLRMNKHDKDALENVVDLQAKIIADAKAQKKGMVAEMAKTLLVTLSTIFAALVLYHFGVRA